MPISESCNRSRQIISRMTHSLMITHISVANAKSLGNRNKTCSTTFLLPKVIIKAFFMLTPTTTSIIFYLFHVSLSNAYTNTFICGLLYLHLPKRISIRHIHCPPWCVFYPFQFVRKRKRCNYTPTRLPQ